MHLGYGESTYLTLVNQYENILCIFMMDKAKLTHRFVSIPRSKLVAAVLAVKISAFAKKSMHFYHIKLKRN